MSKENNEKVVKDIIEYANNEIAKNKKKNATILTAVLVTVALLVAGFFLLFDFEKPEPTADAEFNGSLHTYTKNSDGTWQVNGLTYKYKLEISGRMPNAAVDSTFVYLSNLESISFEQAWKAAGLSSNTSDYFAVEDAILVDWIQTMVEYDEAYAPTD